MESVKVNRPVVVKLREDAQIPTKRVSDGGYDLYALWDKPVVIHKANTVMMFNTGIKIMFPSEYVALFRERGSTGIINLQLRAGVVEGNFKGEYKLILTNGNVLHDIIYVKKGASVDEIFGVYKETYPNLCDIESVRIEEDELGREILTGFIKGTKGIYNSVLNDEGKIILGYIYPQSKAIAQMVIVKKEDWDFEEVSDEEFARFESVRGDGMLGSSGK